MVNFSQSVSAKPRASRAEDNNEDHLKDALRKIAKAKPAPAAKSKPRKATS